MEVARSVSPVTYERGRMAATRVGRWVQIHPLISDVWVAVVAGSIGVLSATVGQDPVRVPLVLLLIGCALLVVRRKMPWTVWVATVALEAVGVVVGGDTTPVFVPAVVALYTVVSRSAVREGVAATVVTIIAPALAMLAGTGNVVDALVFGFIAWSLIAFLAGLAVRAQRRVVEAAHERARMAELSKEDEAQRRVAEDRIRIARELHDVVAHHVSAINVQAGVASVLLSTDPDGASEALAQVRRSSQQVLRELPAVLGVLRTGDDGPLRAPAPRLADIDSLVSVMRSSGLEVVVHRAGHGAELSPAVELTAYRVVQESLTNAGKYGSGPIEVSIDRRPGWLVVAIRNRPRDPGPVEAAGSGYGLAGMRERVEAIGGRISAGPGERGEWLVRAELPVQPSEQIDDEEAVEL